MTLEERVQQLEDDRAIRDLKARYLRACDGKDPASVRDTLHPERALINYEGFPPFESRDAFVEIYQQFGCQPGIFDMHHAANGVISFDGPARATGKWALYFHNINLPARTLTQFGVEYDDVYVKENGRWWIAETNSRRTSCLIQTVDEAGAATVSVMGEAPATFGDAG